MTNRCSETECRSALLEAAAPLFSEHGYQGVSTRQIAEAAGVNLGLIQYYFGSKGSLFLETVRHMMRANPCLQAGLLVEDCPECPVKCADTLCEFIYAYLEYLLRPTSPQPCRLMYRELNSETKKDAALCTALVDAVSKDFLKPLQDTLVGILEVLEPGIPRRELERHAFSVLGQCSFYSMHRPAIENMWGQNISKSPSLEEIGADIASFTLHSLGIDEETTVKSVTRVFRSNNRSPDSS